MHVVSVKYDAHPTSLEQTPASYPHVLSAVQVVESVKVGHLSVAITFV